MLDIFIRLMHYLGIVKKFSCPNCQKNILTIRCECGYVFEYLPSEKGKRYYIKRSSTNFKSYIVVDPPVSIEIKRKSNLKLIIGSFFGVTIYILASIFLSFEISEFLGYEDGDTFTILILAFIGLLMTFTLFLKYTRFLLIDNDVTLMIQTDNRKSKYWIKMDKETQTEISFKQIRKFRSGFNNGKVLVTDINQSDMSTELIQEEDYQLFRLRKDGEVVISLLHPYYSSSYGPLKKTVYFEELLFIVNESYDLQLSMAIALVIIEKFWTKEQQNAALLLLLV